MVTLLEFDHVTLHPSRIQSGPGSWAWGQLSTCLKLSIVGPELPGEPEHQRP